MGKTVWGVPAWHSCESITKTTPGKNSDWDQADVPDWTTTKGTRHLSGKSVRYKPTKSKGRKLKKNINFSILQRDAAREDTLTVNYFKTVWHILLLIFCGLILQTFTLFFYVLIHTHTQLDFIRDSQKEEHFLAWRDPRATVTLDMHVHSASHAC